MTRNEVEVSGNNSTRGLVKIAYRDTCNPSSVAILSYYCLIRVNCQDEMRVNHSNGIELDFYVSGSIHLNTLD